MNNVFALKFYRNGCRCTELSSTNLHKPESNKRSGKKIKYQALTENSELFYLYIFFLTQREEHYRSISTSLKFQSLTMSLLTARLRTSLGGPPSNPMPVGSMFGCGVTFDVDAMEEVDLGAGKDDLLARQPEMAEHLPSLSELETE